jgi:hypothetical protein
MSITTTSSPTKQPQSYNFYCKVCFKEWPTAKNTCNNDIQGDQSGNCIVCGQLMQHHSTPCTRTCGGRIEKKM